jgi:hypothetical protein
MKLSENQIRNLCKTNQSEILRVLNSTSDVATLSLGAEIITEEIQNVSLILSTLNKLLKHNHVIVREGALNGIMNLYSESKPPTEIIDKLKSMSVSDPSPILKDQVTAMLSEFDSIR